jgi:hypothetical protein
MSNHADAIVAAQVATGAFMPTTIVQAKENGRADPLPFQVSKIPGFFTFY